MNSSHYFNISIAYMDTRIGYLLQSVKMQEATTEEKEELESFWQWAQNDYSVLDTLLHEEKQMIKHAIYEGIQAKIADLDSLPESKQRVLSSSGILLKIAASLAFIAVLSFLWLLFWDSQVEVFQTAFAEHREVVLPDGTRVVLNGNSTLRYNPSWETDAQREVWIEGEAFFDVTHTTNNQKFIVHTGEGENVEVLGTRFNVKIRRGKTEVMLEEGKVRFKVARFLTRETVELIPGEMVSAGAHELLKVKVNPLLYTAWKEHKLYFDQTTLRSVVEILEDTYGLQVTFENGKLADRKLSGQIDARNVADILKALEESLDINITENGGNLFFHLKPNSRKTQKK